MHYQFIIVGSGFAAQIAAINLKQRGWHDFVMLERRDFVGGTWVQNRYPGAAVDVHSPLYSLSNMPHPWTRMFAHQDELAAYTQDIYMRFALAIHTRTSATVTNAQWQEQEQRWQVTVNDTELLTCQFLLNATGALSTPVIPDFAGLDSLSIPHFHTNQWDPTVTYRDKRVAIIGSGASATQVIPAIQPDVSHLHVFQRTPHWVIPRPDMAFPRWVQRLLQQTWFYNALRGSLYWFNELRFMGFKHAPFLLKVLGEWPAKRLLKKHIKDPHLRSQLTPDFTIGCKRIILSNTLHPALAASNVSLHDKHDGIARFYDKGIITTQGEQIECDLVVFATGFDAADGLISYPVQGRQATCLADAWQSYARAYLGTTVPAFPNFFMFGGPNTGIGHTSALFMLESQMAYIASAIDHVISSGRSSIAVTPEAEQAYTTSIHQQMQRTVWSWGGCKSWYQNKAGKVVALYPDFTFRFKRMCKRFKPEHHHLQ